LPARKGSDKMVEMSPQQQASQRQNAEGNSARQRERTNAQSDGPATIEGRNPKGEGEKVE